MGSDFKDTGPEIIEVLDIKNGNPEGLVNIPCGSLVNVAKG